MEYNKLIAEMSLSDEVEGFYVLKAAYPKTTATGKPFLSASLSDRSGSIEIKVWDYSGPISSADEGDVVKIRGTVSEFRGALQITVDRIRLADGSDTYPFYGYLGPKQRWMSWGLELFGMLSPICSFRGSPLCRHEQSIL